MKKQTVAQTTELKQLKREIKESFKTANECFKSSRDRVLQGMADAIICAKKLRRAKEIIGHGGFERWQKQELGWSESDIRTAQNWTRKIKNESVSFYSATSNRMKQAYVIAGIISEDDLASGETSTAPPANPVESATKSAPRQSPTTPAALASVKSHAATVSPAISQQDALSRAKFLVGELVADLNNKIHCNNIPLDDAEAATLAPLKKFFDDQRKAAQASPKTNGKR